MVNILVVSGQNKSVNNDLLFRLLHGTYMMYQGLKDIRPEVNKLCSSGDNKMSLKLKISCHVHDAVHKLIYQVASKANERMAHVCNNAIWLIKVIFYRVQNQYNVMAYQVTHHRHSLENT